MAAGVVRLREDRGRAGAAVAVRPATRPSASASALAAYPPIASEGLVRAYERSYGEIERSVRDRPAEAAPWVEWMRRSAARTQAADAKRYVLLRAFVIARAAGEPIGTLDAIAGDVEPLLADGTPARLVQRAELRAALAERTPAYGSTSYDRADFAGRHEAVVKAYGAVLEWQLAHGAVEGVPTTMPLVRPFLRYCDSTEVRAAFEATRERARQAFAEAVAAARPGASGGPRTALIIDASGSLLNSPPNAIGRRVLGRLSEADWFIVVAVNAGDVRPFADLWLPYRGEVRTQAEAFVSDLRPSGSTELVPALSLADDMKADRICLVSDGATSDGDAVRQYLRGRGKGAPVDVVAATMDDEGGVALMREIARMTGGVFRMGDDPNVGRAE